MQCPKCSSKMEQVEFKGIEVDRCTSCQGIWFDMGEAEELKELAGSEVIDTGSVEVGKEFNESGDIDCPRCNVKMIPMVDNKQNHIWYEACGVCYGYFFDAGEFSDYKNEDFKSFLKDLFAKARS